MQTIEFGFQREAIIPDKRLGRHVYHDSRSRQYRVTPTGSPKSVVWDRKTPVLDQGNLGSCTGNATVGALGTEPFYSTLAAQVNAGKVSLNESLAVNIYSRATQIDSFTGVYPPTDTGSNGLSAAKAAQQYGYINGYQHALSIDDFLSGIQSRPGIVGTSWLTGMDNPSSEGIVKYAGTRRGGHEYEAAELDMTRGLVWFWNSWGMGFGLQGKFAMSVEDLTKALADQGDATFFVPLTQPAPTPTPTPVPVDSADQELVKAMDPWAATILSRFTKAGKAKVAYATWKGKKGL